MIGQKVEGLGGGWGWVGGGGSLWASRGLATIQRLKENNHEQTRPKSCVAIIIAAAMSMIIAGIMNAILIAISFSVIMKKTLSS
jgi:hypothetical protein